MADRSLVFWQSRDDVGGKKGKRQREMGREERKVARFIGTEGN